MSKKLANKLDVLMRNAQDKDNAQEVISFIDQLSIPDLYSVLTHSPHLRSQLSHPRYSDYWAAFLANIPVADEPEFSFSHPSFLSDFEFVFGYIQYMMSLNDCDDLDVSSTENYTVQLKAAVESHSYHALDQLTHGMITLFYGNPQQICGSLTPLILHTLENEALYHGTPGFLLIARVLYHFNQITKLYANELQGEQKTEQNLIADQYLLNAIKNLHMAELLETRSKSEINNAYFGHSLTLSNPFSLERIDLIQNKYLESFPIKLSPESLQYIRETATSILLEQQTKFNAMRQNLANKPSLQKIEKSAEEPVNLFGETPLLFAARINDRVKLNQLLQNEENNVECTDNNGNTALHLAVLCNNSEIVDELLKKHPNLLKKINKNGHRPIELAENPIIKSQLETYQLRPLVLKEATKMQLPFYISPKSAYVPTPKSTKNSNGVSLPTETTNKKLCV